jgi:ribulose-5-phosphate 4-epimerase/fuculose-1-phosphate aldolase
MSVTQLRPSNSADPYYEQRVDLACAFRWAACLNMHESIANHFSLAVSPDGAKFLINPYGRHFSRMRASDLLVVDAHDGEAARQKKNLDLTAWAIHGAMHRNAPQARCVMHLHPKYSTVLASLGDSSMPPIDQNTMRFFGRVAVDDGFDGFGLGEEAERMTRQLGNKAVLVMGNHGVMVTGETVARTFDELYYFERAAETLVTALSTGRELRVAPDRVAQKTAEQWLSYPEFGDRHFQALRAILDEEEPDYRN